MVQAATAEIPKTTGTSERDYVRELARQIAAWAATPEMAVIHRRWCDVNALRRPDRAPVWCKPVGAWAEILPEDDLKCQDPWLRGLERAFRQLLVKKDIDDDTPLESWYGVGAVFDVEPRNCWGIQPGRHKPKVAGGAWAYDPPLKTEADFENLAMPTFAYNDAATKERLARHEELLGDILPVRLVCGANLGATLGTAAANLRGLEQMMMDMVLEPELLHRLMAHLRDATLASIDAAEKTGLVTPNNIGPMNKSDSIGECGDSFKGCWCMGNSQEFDQVSPEHWEEYCLDYQKPIFERYGLVGYGCCESLTSKIDGVLSIPNLRIFVCSAWTNLDTLLEKVSKEYCIMWRQKASDVVFPEDDATIAGDLDAGAKKLQGRPYQIILRELQTLNGHNDRLHVWTRYAKEAAAKYA